jgi:MFS family permease
MYQALAVAYVSSAAVGIKGPIGALSLVFATCLGAVVPIVGKLSDRFGARVRDRRPGLIATHSADDEVGVFPGVLGSKVTIFGCHPLLPQRNGVGTVAR